MSAMKIVNGVAVPLTEQDIADDQAKDAAEAVRLAAEGYKDARRFEYPPVADQLDALWKGGADEAAMRARIEAVKAKYPKPDR